MNAPTTEALASRLPILSLTRAYEWVLRVGFGILPLLPILYLHSYGNPELRFSSYPFHEVAISIAIGLSGFVAYVTWRCYRHSGEPFLLWVAQGLAGFTLVYLPHGVLTRLADCNIWLFLLFGPMSRVVMVGCLFIGLLHYGQPAHTLAQRRSLRPLWQGMVVFLLIDALTAVLSYSATVNLPTLRLLLEYGAIALALAAIALLLKRRITSPLMYTYAYGMAAFAQSCLAFVYARPWDHLWWLGHAIFAGGFFVLSYGIVHAFHTTRAFSAVYSQEEMMRQLEQANANLLRLASEDPLTGAANRRYFMSRAEEELSRAVRHQTDLTLLAIDLDHFKVVNDTHGHQAGDTVLTVFVNRLRRLLRPSDLIGRVGGEEFMVLLPAANLEQAAQVAQRIRDVMDQEVIALPGVNLHVTVSIGIAEFPTDGSNIGQLIKHADQRLYRAKQGGRNRVVL